MQRDGAYQEPLTNFLISTFTVSWEKNSTYQLAFTAIDDGSMSFNLLKAENIITFKGQQYIIKQCVPNYTDGYNTMAITATHVYSDLRRIYKRDKKEGTLTYSVNDVLSFYLDKNDFGYSFKVYGTFGKQQITDLGGDSGMDMLSKIVATWTNAIIFPDNKSINVYTEDAFGKNYGNRLGYGYNSNNITLTYDSTSIVNQLKVFGKQKDDDSKSYYFDPHFVKDDESIKKYGLYDGGDLSDERFTDPKAIDEYAKKQLVTEPTLSVTLEYQDLDEPIAGEIKRFEIIKSGFSTDIMVVSFSYYPFDVSQKSNITLNSNNKTVLDYQRNNDKKMEQTKKDQSNISKAITEGVWYNYGGDNIES